VTKLNFEQVKDYASRCAGLPVGATERFNHGGCATSEGSRSLAVTRQPDGGLLMYCHKCQGNGSYGGEYRPGLERERSGIVERKPPDWSYRITDWPVKVKLWLNRCAVSHTVLEKLKVRYDRSNSELQLTIWGEDGTPTGRINRSFSGEDGPKYVSYGQRTWLRRTDSPTLVVVEDYLSATQTEQAGFNSLLIGGTRVPDHCIPELVEGNANGEGFNRVVIWLDNDNPAVRESRRRIKAQLEWYFPVEVIRLQRDPKTYTTSELKEILQ
jgi:hypothetical protein